LSIVHVLNHSISHSIHELLSSLFSGLELIDSVLFLFFEHSGILLLGSNVFLSLLFLFLGGLCLLSIVFSKHFLQVFLLLTSFF
jgi:hypothetical protein